MGYFIFGNIDTRDYGVEIFNLQTDNAPEREYEKYNIPGRNGDLYIDKQKYANIEHSYWGVIYENYEENLANFRSAMKSQLGYKRLEDSIHTDEFYVACFVDVFSVETSRNRQIGRFQIIFDRKPQRFLLSGDTSVTYPPGVGSGKNLMQFPYVDTSKTAYGITWSVDDAGVITVSGQKSSGIPAFNLSNSNKLSTTLTNGETYILSGCPEGGGSSTYRMALMKNYAYTYDYGDGIEFVYDSSATYSITANVYTSSAIENVVFKPMIRKATDSDGWEPYYDGATHIYNPTLFASNPIIRVNGSGTLTIGSDVIAIRSGYNYVDINSEIQDCYCGMQNANSVVTFQSGKYP